ncbi:MAG TPA: hypothetical protein VFC14_08485 [Burkholderiales bacterium]|nr:hypothetical protein [Burkholderiales bacterium]
MGRDPAKRITAFGIGIHRGEIRAVLLINDRDRLVVPSVGLNHEEAELLCDGFVDALRESTDLDASMIDAFLDDPEAIEALAVPLDASPAKRELFKQGAIGGLRLAADGYWLDVYDASEPRTIH